MRMLLALLTLALSVTLVGTEDAEAITLYGACCNLLAKVPETIPDQHHVGEIDTGAGDLCSPLAPHPVR